MRKINEKDYVTFTIHIKRNGCNITFNTLKNALSEWENINAGILYGNKANGEREQLDAR